MSDQARTLVGNYEALRRGFRLETSRDDADLARFLQALLAPLASSSVEHDCPLVTVLPPTEAGAGRIAIDGTVYSKPRTRGVCLRNLMQHCSREIVDRLGADQVVLHAAAAASEQGGLLLPADMEAGKTTLVAGLLDRGWTYLTDEAAGISRRLEIEGYAKPLSIDKGSWDVLPHLQPTGVWAEAGWFDEQWQVVPNDIAASAPLRMIVFPSYEKGATTELTRLTPGDAVERALQCTFVAEGTHPPVETIRRLASMVETIPAYSLVNGDLDEACDAVERAWQDTVTAGA